MTYSFRRAHETDAFHQLPLLSDDNFVTEAKARINLALSAGLRERLEELDRVGALRPVAFARASERAQHELIFREDAEFRPWDEYALDEDGFRRPRAVYSHWQLLYVKEAAELGVARVSIDWLFDASRRSRVSEGYQQFYEHQGARWRGLDDEWRPIVLLLTRLQNRYFPVVRGTLTKITSTLVFDPEVGDYVDPYRKTVREFDPAAVLEELSLTAEDIKELHQRLGIHGVTNDPLERFHMLFRMAPYRERAKLQGEARQAQDAYDAAEMLRRLYHDLTGGELLPTPDEIFDGRRGEWKERLFGHGPRLRYNPHDLQVELIRHHLYPHTVHLVAEGESDELLFRGLLDALGGSAADLGITFSNLEGIGRTRLHAKILRAAKSYARFPVLVVDRENDIERDVELLKREGLLSDETVFLWNASLEEDNFTDDELVAIAARIAERKGCVLDLDGAALRSAYESQRERAGKGARGLAKVLLDLAGQPEHGNVAISKPELAEEMTRWLLGELDEAEDQDALVERRPVLGIVLSIIRVA